MTVFFSSFFSGKSKVPASAPALEPTPAPVLSTISLEDPRYAAWFEKRRAYWSAIGAVDDDVVAYIISPEFQGAPAWPTTRQAFFVVRTPKTVIIASDGLSDLFVDTDMDEAGFGTEVYIETPALIGADFQQIKSSWAFSLIEDFARNVANWGGIDALMTKYGVISTELAMPEGLENRWETENHAVGILVNLPNPSRDRTLNLDPEHNITMVPITIIMPGELAFVAEGGAEARMQLAHHLAEAGVGAVSDADRETLA